MDQEDIVKRTCCVTGHRHIPPEAAKYVMQRLREEVSKAIAEGFTRFLSGYAAGVDQLFVQAVMEEMDEHPEIHLEAALPYRKRFQQLMYHPDTKYLLLAAVDRYYACETYAPGCFQIRNRYMVDESARVIAVHDERKTGGTAATLRYAEVKGRDVRKIEM